MGNEVIKHLSSVCFDSYKSFSSGGPFYLKLDKNIILIIGRKNCGKSSLVDVVEELFLFENKRKIPEGMNHIRLEFCLDKERIETVFSKDTYSISSGMSDREYGNGFLNHLVTFEFVQEEEKRLAISDSQIEIFGYGITKPSHEIGSWNRIAKGYENELRSCKLRRLNADRDVVPEPESERENVSTNGNGATNLIRKIINTEIYDEAYVEKTLLAELNKIMEPDAHFNAIRVQQISNGSNDGYNWEVFLEEDGHRYALSKSGSGLKTIILILINLHLVSHVHANRIYSDYCYAFEEIENNLHPALQRRVFEYLYEYAVNNGKRIILTTHSHIAINMMYGKENARIYHVVKTKGQSRLNEIENSKDRSNILDDLDVKASDLYQTNGIIWVEGPTDKTYILKWLEVLTENKYKEGLNFQFLYYGGRLLAHYKANEPGNNTDELINILTTNRNVAIVMDSDKQAEKSHINSTKRRVRDEMKAKGLFCWITQGKEIENYLSSEALNKTYHSELEQIGAYEEFPTYIKKQDPNYVNHKVDSSRAIVQNITKENSKDILDLRTNIEKLYVEISKWNRIEL